MRGRSDSPRVLHIHGTLAAGAPLAERCIRVASGLGGKIRHTFVSADGAWDALDALGRGVTAERCGTFPLLSGLPHPGRLQKIAQAMVDYHLVLTYGRGATDAALAHTMFSQLHHLPPLIHHEDGSDETPRQREGLRSTWYRRVGLGKCAGLVVPTELMEGEALVRWQQPMGRIKTIPDGVDLDSLDEKPRGDAIPRLIKRPGERWIGCAAPLGGWENTHALLVALREVEPEWHLILLSGGPDAGRTQAAVGELALDNRVHFLPTTIDPVLLTLLADVIAITDSPEPLPYAALEAMGAGKPVIGFETGELSISLSPDNAPFVVDRGDHRGFTEALQQLAADDFLRRRTGAANRERARADRDSKAMIAAYRRLYASALGRETV